MKSTISAVNLLVFPTSYSYSKSNVRKFFSEYPSWLNKNIPFACYPDHSPGFSDPISKGTVQQVNFIWWCCSHPSLGGNVHWKLECRNTPTEEDCLPFHSDGYWRSVCMFWTAGNIPTWVSANNVPFVTHHSISCCLYCWRWGSFDDYSDSQSSIRHSGTAVSTFSCMDWDSCTLL